MKTKSIIIMAIFVFFYCMLSVSFAEIRTDQCTALMELYNGMNGDS